MWRIAQQKLKIAKTRGRADQEVYKGHILQQRGREKMD
jgi:hypothetical protein